MLQTFILDVVGAPPVGWEFSVYWVAILLFLIVFASIIRMFVLPVFRLLRGRFR